MNILLLDNYDSFTYNLYDYLLQAGAECQVVRNDALSPEAFEQLPFDAVVLSPGPKRPADAGAMMPLLERWHTRVPILGICLGHQAIGELFGAPLVQSRVPVHGKTSTVLHDGQHPLFKDIPLIFKAMRYHSLLIRSLEGTPLQPLAHTESGEIMALAHPEIPLAGVQFHPESILTEHGLALLKNWLAWIEHWPARAGNCHSQPEG